MIRGRNHHRSEGANSIGVRSETSEGSHHSIVRLDARVGAAVAGKYWMDVLIRHESHPMVARLVPEVTPPETSSH